MHESFGALLDEPRHPDSDTEDAAGSTPPSLITAFSPDTMPCTTVSTSWSAGLSGYSAFARGVIVRSNSSTLMRVLANIDTDRVTGDSG